MTASCLSVCRFEDNVAAALIQFTFTTLKVKPRFYFMQLDYVGYF